MINILLNENITKYLVEERKELIKMINNIESITFNQDSKRIRKIKFNDFLKKIVKFIILGIEKLSKSNTIKPTEFNIVLEALQFLVEILMYSDENRQT